MVRRECRSNGQVIRGVWVETTSSTSPCSTISPSLSTIKRLATDSAKSRFCSTSKTAMPSSSRARIRTSPMRSTIAGCNPSLTSSISINFGWAIRPRDINSIFCSPPDNVPARCFRLGHSGEKGFERQALVEKPVRSYAQPEILFDRQIGKSVCSWGYEPHRACHHVRSDVRNIIPVQRDSTAERTYEAHDCFQQGWTYPYRSFLAQRLSRPWKRSVKCFAVQQLCRNHW